MRPQTFIAVLYTEWLAWLEFRELRCLVSRIRQVDQSDVKAFSRVIATMPFAAPGEDDSAIVARLSDRLLVPGLGRVASFETSELVRVPLEMVESFHAVTERGGRLLQIDAERRSCELHPPINESAWNDWVELEQERLAHRRGMAFLRFLSLDRDFDVLAGESTLPRESSLTQELRRRNEDSCSLGWAEAFAYCRGRLSESDHSVLLSPELVRVVQIRLERTELADESFASSDGIAAVNYIEALMGAKGYAAVPLIAVAALHHFAYYLRKDKPVTEALLASIGEAVEIVRRRYSAKTAAELAYRIGRDFPEAHSASLEVCSDPARFPAMSARPLPFEPSCLLMVKGGVDVMLPKAADDGAELRSLGQAPIGPPEARAESYCNEESRAAEGDGPTLDPRLPVGDQGIQNAPEQAHAALPSSPRGDRKRPRNPRRAPGADAAGSVNIDPSAAEQAPLGDLEAIGLPNVAGDLQKIDP